MLKYKPFLVFMIITALAFVSLLSSFLVSAYINGKYEAMIPILAMVEVSDDTACAVYTYNETEYSSQIPYSSVLKNTKSIPIYIDPSYPDKAELKDLSAVLMMRIISVPVFIISAVGSLITYFKYKKR